MILDALMELADAQESTVAVASTNVVDTLAGGDAYSGGMGGLFYVIRIDTAFTTGAGDPTCVFQLQTSDIEAFGEADDITLVQSSTFASADLTANKIIALPIPGESKRYVRGYFSIFHTNSDANKFSAGKWDMYITKDAPITRELA